MTNNYSSIIEDLQSLKDKRKLHFYRDEECNLILILWDYSVFKVNEIILTKKWNSNKDKQIDFYKELKDMLPSSVSFIILK